MIVVDIETSGQYPEKHGIWQIGALDFYNHNNLFFGECRIDDEDEIQEGAVKVHGKDEAYLRNKNKRSQRLLLRDFCLWCESVRMKNALCQNPRFDAGFIEFKIRKYNLKIPYHHGGIDPDSPWHYRAFDLHSIVQSKYHRIFGSYLIMDNHSDMGLTNIINFCGLPIIRGNHNALEDAKLTAECFSRIEFGKNLISEYSEYPIPQELRI